MIVSTMPTSFPESEQSSSPELSDELTTALATGKPEYGDLTSGEWWGKMEAGVTSCPTSLVSSDESVKTESPYSGFPDEARKTKEQWRQKSQVAHVPPRSQQGAPVPAHTNKRDHTASLGFNDALDKAGSSHPGLSDATLKTTEQWRKWRQKPQGTPSPAKGRDLISSPVFSVKSEHQHHHQQGTPVSGCFGTGSTTACTTACKVSTGSTSADSIPPRNIYAQQASAAGTSACSKGSTCANKTPLRQRPKIPDRLRQELLELSARASSRQGAPMPDKISERQNLKISETLRPGLQQQKPNKTPVRKRLKITDPLRQELLELSAQASTLQGAPELLELAARALTLQGAPVPKKTPVRQRLKIPDPLRQELLELSARAPRVKETPVIKKNPERQRLKIPERLRKELLREKP
ncbi:neurofilament heavy polypeptide-like protein [Labeo rohita]|uniref:Neurofilament heavy polypeptide-like protein n=1 Tax=Labeo rohita TaxID=84645 RepID=A0A498LUV9_LABRO|nr:neurofilament heavy polypeptide-like protein [Labeo rohita]